MVSVSETLLVRHGQSVSNAGLATMHPAATGLTDLGRLQARQVAAFLTDPPDRVVVSPFLRARDTATPTLERFRLVAEEWPVQEFTYLSPDRYVGTTLVERRPAVREYWKRLEPHSRDGEGSESFAEAVSRAQTCLERLRLAPGTTVVFSHGQFIRLLLWITLSRVAAPDAEDMSRFAHFRLSFSVPNVAVLRLRFPTQSEVLLGPPRLPELTPEQITF